MSSLIISIRTNKDHQQYKKSGQKNQNMNRLLNLIAGLNAGSLLGEVFVQGSSADTLVAASGTFTVTSAIATDAITIGSVTLTASSTPADENEWEIDGASDALDAASLAACINAHSVLSKIVVASSASNVVTVTVLQKGVLGNQLPISSADATIVASGVRLTGGAGGATDSPEQVR